jgi:hypothetical protein
MVSRLMVRSIVIMYKDRFLSSMLMVIVHKDHFVIAKIQFVTKEI